MNKCILFLFIYQLLSITPLSCQVTEQPDVNISISSGLVNNISTDQLLNYYKYSAYSFLPVKLESNYLRNKNLLIANVYYNNSTLKPANIQDAYYKYNYIKQWHLELNLEFYRSILYNAHSFRFFIGVANNSNFLLQEEYYDNILYDFAKGYRKSYDLSLINISPSILLLFTSNQNTLRLKAGYSLINIGSRPNDNFVKQIGVNDRLHWKVYSPKDFTNYQFSIFYQYNFFNKIGLNAEYNVLFRSYLSSTEYKFLRKLYLIGVSKSF